MQNTDPKEFVTVVSKDNKEFFLDLKVAQLCKYFAQQFKIQTSPPRLLKLDNIDGQTLEIVLQYLHYKSKNQHKEEKLVPSFKFQPLLGFDVLKAALFLEI